MQFFILQLLPHNKAGSTTKRLFAHEALECTNLDAIFEGAPLNINPVNPDASGFDP